MAKPERHREKEKAHGLMGVGRGLWASLGWGQPVPRPLGAHWLHQPPGAHLESIRAAVNSCFLLRVIC